MTFLRALIRRPPVLLLLAAAVLTSCEDDELRTARRRFRAASFSSDFQPGDTTAAQRDNPMTGFHQWRGLNLVPGQAPVREVYQRYFWRDLEPAEDQYQFGTLLNDLQAARTAGAAFSFRIRMMAGYDDDQRYYPGWLLQKEECVNRLCEWQADTDPADPGVTYLPDWNHPYILARSEKLLKALGQALPAGARIAWIDVGMYGQYGEWTVSSSVNYAAAPLGITPVTEASKQAYTDMHIAAFPGRQLLMFALRANVDAIVYARNATTAGLPAGLRTDCLGRTTFFDQWTSRPLDFAKISGFWKTAPFVAEFCGFEQSDPANSFASALAQLKTYHITSVGNGNFGPENVSVSQRYAAMSPSDQAALNRIAASAGARIYVARLEAEMERLGRFFFTVTWKNLGNAPLYADAELVTEFRDATGPVYRYATPYNFASLDGSETGTTSYSGSANFAETNLEGLFDVHWYIRDRATGRRIRPFTAGVLADTTLRIGTFTLAPE